MGYHRAGFEVVGVDIDPHPRYPFEFHQGDALKYLLEHHHEFDAFHASPPCQAWTLAQRIRVEHRKLCGGGSAETYPPCKPVDNQALGADQLSKGSGCDPAQ